MLQILGGEPVFQTGFLLAGNVDPQNVRRQLSRWVRAGKVYQLRRSVYCLAPPYQKIRPHPFLAANRLQPHSYVSLQSALAWYGMIPEYVPVTTSVTTGRPESLNTPLGRFQFQHIQRSWFYGYRQVDLGKGQLAFLATPEKALLDLIYLYPGGDQENYLRELRLQALEQIDQEALIRLVQESRKPKLERAAKVVAELAEEEEKGFKPL